MQVKSYKTHKIVPGEDLLHVLDRYLPAISEKSVVAVTSKIVSICQGRVVKVDHKKTHQREQLVAQEAEYYVDPRYSKYGFTISIKNDIFIASAGIDESNGNGYFVLWPENVYASARQIWEYVRKKYRLTHLGVIITDSKTTPLRWGVTGVGIAFCGFVTLNDYRGQLDIFGRPLHVTQANVLDGLAAAAVLVMGEGSEQTPLSVISDAPFVTFLERPPAEKEIASLKISLQDDIYAPLIDSGKWKKGKRRAHT